LPVDVLALLSVGERLKLRRVVETEQNGYHPAVIGRDGQRVQAIRTHTCTHNDSNSDVMQRHDEPLACAASQHAAARRPAYTLLKIACDRLVEPARALQTQRVYLSAARGFGEHAVAGVDQMPQRDQPRRVAARAVGTGQLLKRP
jgi:hypothetical protein